MRNRRFKRKVVLFLKSQKSRNTNRSLRNDSAVIQFMVAPEVIINEPPKEDNGMLGGVQSTDDEPPINSDVFYLDDEKQSNNSALDEQSYVDEQSGSSPPPRLLPNSNVLMKALTLRNLNNRRRFHSLSSYAGMEQPPEESFCR